MKCWLKVQTLLLIFSVCIPTSSPAQAVFVNGEAHQVSTAWLDSAKADPAHNTIRYNITGAHSYGSFVTTTIRIPQVLTLRQVIRQILLYYFMLDDDSTRNSEQLYIYPYFVEQNQPPLLRVRYQSENVYVELTEWKTIRRPNHPTPEERDIYNQIVEDFFTEVQEYNTMSEERFLKIAQKNNMRIERVRKIYEDVILWNLTR